jgi:hypothetical protein
MGQSRTITFSKGTAEYKLYFRDSHYAPTGTSLTSTSNALTIAADRPGTYTYTFDSIVDKNGTGCRSLADFKITSDNTWTVTVHALPTAEITETTICQNTNATLTFTGKSPFTLTGTPAGTWTYASGATIGIPTPYTGTWGTATQLSSPNPTDDMSYPVAVLAGSAGTFNFSGTLTDANGCSATVSDAVTVNAEPTIDIATPVCQNTNNNITLTGKAPWNVAWTSSPSVGVASPLTISGSPYQIMSGSAGTFTFTVAVGGLVDDNKCANTTVITKDVVVNPEPAIKLEYEELCQNANNNILVLAGTSTPSVNMNVAWTVSPTIGITSPMNLTASSTSIVSGQPGSFNFTVAAGGLTDNNTGCKNINALTQNVVVNPLPTVDFTPTTICAGDAITLNFTGKASVTKFTLDYKVEDVTLSTGRIAPETIGLPASDFNSLTTGTTDADGTTHYTATLNPGKPGDFKFYLKSVSDGTCTNNNPSPLW